MDSNLMDAIEPIANEIRDLDIKISALNGELKELKSDREQRSEVLVADLQQHGIETHIGLPDGKTVKLKTDTYVTVLNMEELQDWAKLNDATLPVMQFHPSTISAWYKEQLNNNQPVPPVEMMKPFIKTRIGKIK